MKVDNFLQIQIILAKTSERSLKKQFDLQKGTES